VRKRLKDLVIRFRDVVLEYGAIALVVHYAIFALVITGFWMAVRAGWEPTTAAGDVGSWTAAYVMAKITQPLRIVATIAVTPLIARWYERRLAPIAARVGLRMRSKPPGSTLD